MSNRLERLIKSYSNFISIPWTKGLADEQRVLFAVYHKEDELKLRARVEEFKFATESAGHKWVLIDITQAFPRWLADQEYKEEIFSDPDSLETALDLFVDEEIESISAKVLEQADNETVVALLGAGSLFGICSVSGFVKRLAGYIPGRLLVLFPGEYVDNKYRLLDARDGWGYLATAITAEN
ncbi:DUF1788 domain-containing protein [Pseudidiomarina sp. YC-516-91]|uniref:DUF1788 domain-containing protein n=1 Tax=Pseudidiomarina salilacus TaxID=3384452 RepID=UPI0039846A22